MKKNLTLFTVFIIIISSCEKESFNISNLNNNRVTVLGHGGMGYSDLYPMNSFESIFNCIIIGADGSEIDVQMTKDSVLLAFHDKFLEQSTYFSGQIFNKNWDEINNAKYKDPPYTNYEVVTLDNIFSNIENLKNYTFFLECKNYNPDTSLLYRNTFINALIRLIDKYELENNVCFEFKRKEIIKSLKAKRPDLKIFIYSNFEDGLNTAKDLQLTGITISVDDVSKEQVVKAHSNGIMINVFGTNTKNKNIEAIEKNVDFIQSDKLKHLIKMMK
ncbi:MAG: glycerophosphodiester phosphodiesterase family protein [Bacteroidota bacterium]|nr:glycerophosphodiester phosphodiesterase family protein [Bacteroidota bacterium]